MRRVAVRGGDIQSPKFSRLDSISVLVCELLRSKGQLVLQASVPADSELRDVSRLCDIGCAGRSGDLLEENLL